MSSNFFSQCNAVMRDINVHRADAEIMTAFGQSMPENPQTGNIDDASAFTESTTNVNCSPNEERRIALAKEVTLFDYDDEFAGDVVTALDNDEFADDIVALLESADQTESESLGVTATNETDFVGISLPRRPISKAEPKCLTDEFFQFLSAEGYTADRDLEVVSAWNCNFSLKCTRETEVLRYYLILCYNFDVTESAVETFSDVLYGKLLHKLGQSHRTLDDLEIASLLRVIDCDWFDINLFHRYSLECRDTNLLLQLMERHLIDEDRLQKYANLGADTLNAYMLLALRGDYVDTVFDMQVAMDDNLQHIIASTSEDRNSLLIKIAARTDGKLLIGALTDSEFPTELLQKYVEHDELLSIIRSYDNNCYDEYLVSEILGDSQLMQFPFVRRLYEEGKIDCEIYKEYHDLFSTLVVQSTKDFGKFDLTVLLRVLEKHRHAVLLVCGAAYRDTNALSPYDFRKLVFVMCSKYGEHCAAIIEEIKAFGSVRELCIRELARRVGVTYTGLIDEVISQVTGDSLAVVEDSKIHMHSMDELLTNRTLCATFHGEVNFELIPSKHGIIVGLYDHQPSDAAMRRRLGSSSVDTALMHHYESVALANGCIARTNGIIIRKRLIDAGCHEASCVTKTLFGENDTSYGSYDLALGYILEYFPALAWLLCSDNALFYLECIRALCTTNIRVVFVYQLLFYVLQAQFGDHFKCQTVKCSLLNPGEEKVLVSGLSQLSTITFGDLFHGFDGLLDCIPGNARVTLGISNGVISLQIK